MTDSASYVMATPLAYAFKVRGKEDGPADKLTVDTSDGYTIRVSRTSKSRLKELARNPRIKDPDIGLDWDEE